MSQATRWPRLHYPDLQETLTTVQLWTQIVGKIRLCQMPWTNHSWHVSLYVSPLGLTTGSMPCAQGVFQLEFDFVRHQLLLTTSNNDQASLPLTSGTVSDFYHQLLNQLLAVEIEVDMYARPNEVDPAIPFAEDQHPRVYQPEAMHQVWQALLRIHNVFTDFRAGFVGKCSPVHLFWGAFDLAVTRFSGREAPPHPGGMPNMPLAVMQEAYSHEVSSAGFWPGNDAFPEAAFYSYCYPTPDSFKAQRVLPEAAYFHEDMGEFVLPYEVVRQADEPENMLTQFLQSTYEAAATTGEWNRTALEADFSHLKR